MPGKAFPLKLPNDITMQCYADLGTGLLYFSTAVKYPVIVGNTDSVLSAVARNIANTGSVEKQTSITSNRGARAGDRCRQRRQLFYPPAHFPER